MNEPIDIILRRLISVCPSPSELRRRVRYSLGESHLSRAFQLAAEVRGTEWLGDCAELIDEDDAEVQTNILTPPQMIRRSTYAPQNLTLCLGFVATVAVILFPPYVFTFSQGIVTDAGFSSLFSAPQSGQFRAVVNTPLLAALLTGVAMATIMATLIARSFEQGDAYPSAQAERHQ